MDSKAAMKARLENLSPEQRAALLRKVALLREQKASRPPAQSRYPLSLAQRRLWMLSQLGNEASAAYNIASVFYFEQPLEAERLQNAWRRLIARHEVLRSAFAQEGGELFQTPRDASQWSMHRHELVASQDTAAQLLALASEEAAKAFDLEQDWLLKVIYCQSATGPAGLVVVMQHIVCDGLSITSMIQELAQFYGEALEASQVETIGSVQQYRDYIEYEARADNSKAQAYWKDIFSSPPETLDTLLDLPRSVQKDFSGKSFALTVAEGDVKAFEALCHGHNATLYMGLVALVQLLLARFANVDEVTLGTPVAGRPGAQFDKVVGPFVNTVALRQSVDRQQTFPELLKQVRSRVLGGFQYQGLAFDELVTTLGFAKDPSRSPLYDVMLGFTTAEDQALSFDDIVGQALQIPLKFSKVDLTFHFEKANDGSLRLDLEYADSLLLETSAKRLCDACHLMLCALPKEPEIKLGDLALQTEEERRSLIEDVNATTRPYPQQSSLVSEFRKSVERFPEAIAVHAGDVQLSYRGLDKLSDQLAHSLLKHPAYRANCRIALMLEKDERALIVILAILKSRCVYVPLASNTPLDRVGQVLSAGEVRLLFAQTQRMGELESLGVALIDSDALLAEGSVNFEDVPPLPEITTTNVALEPAYLMFTSGSTGVPKGTLIEQHSVLRLVCNTDFHQVQANERMLLTGSLAFDAATFEIWGPLLNGGCVCIPAGTTLLEVHEFAALVDHYQVDTAFLTTGLFNQLVDNSAPAFSRLQTVLTGGEKISVEHVRKLLQAQPGVTLLHVYGPTENTTFSTWHRISTDDLNLATIPIGRPVANSRLYLLDQNMQPVPIGVPGEIYCGGDGIARGYIEQEKSSLQSDGGSEQASVFLPDPFVPTGANRLYRTGDLAKWNHKRELVFIGRNDRQVKIRGFRVELGEVEFQLRTLANVSDAFVQNRGDAGSSELVAWLVVPAGVSLTVASVRDGLKGRVLNYMLPAKVVCLQRLPLNASGKVDVHGLPLPEDADAGSVSVGQLLGKAEQDLASLYASVLGLTGNAAKAVDRDANFFSLGGDSIRAIQLVSLARSDGYQFTLKDIFASETLAGLAASATVSAPVESEENLLVGPLSPTQRWWLDQSDMPANHFNLSSVFRIAGSIDMSALRAALDELLTLHPALCLRLDTDAQEQSIAVSGHYVLRELQAGQSRQQCWQGLQKAIDLNKGVLLAVGVAAEGDETWLAIVVHHIAADEVSGRLFGENLERLYKHYLADPKGASSSAKRQPMREALGLINWAAQLKGAVTQGAMDQDLGYWQDVVAQGRHVLDQQQNLFAEDEVNRSTTVKILSCENTQELLQLGSSLLRMTPPELVLAAFLRAWQSTLDSTDCLLSLEGHGREQYEGLGDCSSTMGWFTSLYPCVFIGIETQGFDLYREVKDIMRRLPSKGFTYLPLRYFKDQEVGESLALKPRLSFNYLGESVEDDNAWLRTANEPAGDDHGDDFSEPFKLDVLARITQGQLELTVRGQSPNETLTLSALADAWQLELRGLSTRLQALTQNKPGNESLLSLSDCFVPFTSLAQLDDTLAQLGLPAASVEEILPLTGMQSGMWMHCSTQPTAYQDQVALRLQQPLDEQRFAAAVRALVDETQALRTGFAQTSHGELLQIIFRERTGYYQYLDARMWGEGFEEDLTRLRVTLRENPRDLLRDSLFNLTLVQISASCFELIIDFHHIALDGWTSALLLQRLEALYFATAVGRDRDSAQGMRPYFEWLGQQPVEQARDYWQRLLGDYNSRSDVPTHLPRIPAVEPEPLFVEIRTGSALNTSLRAWCEQQGLTLNAAVQTLWGIYLGGLTGSDDVVYGATVSGRDSDFAGVANIAGMLINTLPVRIRTGDSASFSELVRETAQQFAESMSFGHLTLAEIQTFPPARAGLVTHALVFENYPDAQASRWQWHPQEIFDPMHFEFGLIVAPLRDDLSFRFVADGSLYRQDKLERMGTQLCALLAQLLEAEQPFDTLTNTGVRGWSLSANFTADSLLGLLQYHEYISGNSSAVTLLPYDQSVQELINPNSRLRRLQAQRHIVLWRPVIDGDGKVLHSASVEQLEELCAAAASYARAAKGSRLYFLPCPWEDCYSKGGDWTLYREFSAFVKGALAGLRNAEVLSLEALDTVYALTQPCHPPALIFGDIPYTEEFFAAVANQLARRRDLQDRPPVKVFVVDADDTLWGGIVGEEGVQGIRLETPHIQLQELLLSARAAGALICVATKNNEEDVRAVFEQREMPLRWEHLTRVCAGWAPKSESILTLADELSLGLDSFVFIDDSPLECEQVLAACPGVLAIQVPPAERREVFLAHLWLLDARAATQEDAVRSQMYAEELQRVSARKSTGSYGDFLASLDIRVVTSKPVAGDLPRVAQLSERTNQFNTTGIRYSETELDTLLLEPDVDIHCIRVSDKYGDYGLAGSMYVRRGDGVWTVLGLMLSCRVLGRGVEHTILRQLAQEAAAVGAEKIHVDFIKLARNSPALQFLQSIAQETGQVSHNGQVASQYLLAVHEAAHWQPGSQESNGQQDADASNTATQEIDTAVDQGSLQVAGRKSGYYGELASMLNSGAAILNVMQQQREISKTGSAGRDTAQRTAPTTPTEKILASYFSELLGQTEISQEDSFYELGGHSLKAMMLFSRIAARYGVTLDFRDLQAYPTLSALATRIDASAPDASLAAAPVLRALAKADNYPVSPGQSRLWMLEHIRAAGPSPLHMHATVTVDGALNRQALDLAFKGLLLRHEALRTCFRENAQGQVRQWVVSASTLKPDVVWFDDVLDDAQLNAVAQEQCGLAFDLTKAPLIRMAAGALASGQTVLLITMHHIISDGWSIGIFSKELSDLYKQYNAGSDDEDSLPEDDSLQLQAKAVQFRDFAQWQLAWLAAEAGARDVSFWREHFANPVEALQLPSAAPRPTLMQSEGASVQIDIDAATWTNFTRQLSSLGVSDFAGLFATLQLVLGRLSGQKNFCVGTAVAGRQHQALESVIGFFVNILPLRTTLEFEDSVEGFLRGVAEEVNTCLSHQAVPFDTIVSSLDLPRDPGRTPLFDVLLVLQNTEIEDLKFGTQVAQVQPLASTTSQYDLTLSAFPAQDGSLKLLAEYDNVIYSAANIELILRCIGRTLQGLTDRENETLANTPWIQESDMARVKAFEGMPLECKPVLLPEIFTRAVAQASGRISDVENDWSYSQLESEMHRIAALIRAARANSVVAPPASIRKQTHIGVIGNRSARSIAAMLGAMEAGAVYIPLDLDNPLDRLLLIISEGAVDLLLSTDERGADLARDLQQRHPRLQHLCYSDKADQTQEAQVCKVAPTPADVAYMIFTSGSTGKPKGVQISHGAFSAMIEQQIPAFDVKADDVLGQFAALSFDASLSEIFLALGTGASLAIAPNEARSDIDIFMSWMSDEAVTVITLPPVFLRALNKRPMDRLRVLVTAGEAAIGADMRHYAASLRVINAYGPTETSVCATSYLVNAQDEWPFGVPIGKPLPGILVTVRDNTGARVPVGCAGELYIGGATLSDGYYAANELSAEKFGTIVDDPQQGRWYRSGDLVRWREDGLLEFQGRVDAQIKVRGYRIEPGEIEHAARNIEGVRDAVAIIHPQLGLLLYCLTSSTQITDDIEGRSKVLAELGKVLPRYMIPSDVWLLETFPLSSAGKVERATLLALVSARETQFTAPETKTEHLLAKTWMRVLKAERVGKQDDFFALGGDSIKALEVINALRALGLTCALKDFFASPLLSEMAGILTPWHASNDYQKPLAGSVALLPVQNWFLHSRDREAAEHFHIVAELETQASVTVTVLSTALMALVQNHDSLRTCFTLHEEKWEQEIQETISVEEFLLPYRRQAASVTQAEQAAIEALACNQFSLEAAPLFRCVLVQGPSGESESVVLALHHLIADWVSLRILIADLNALTQAILSDDGTEESALLPVSPPHLLGVLANDRATELSSILPLDISEAMRNEYRKAVSTMDGLEMNGGVHRELQTLHLQIPTANLTRLREALRSRSAAENVELNLQDFLLAEALAELSELLPVDEVPLLIEGHGREGTLDLARQVAWLTRARLFNLDPRMFKGTHGLIQAHRVLQADASLQPDVFACLSAEPALRGALPALISFNYLGEFANSQNPEDLFNLTSRVFDKAMAATSPVDVPLHLEFYVVDYALEIQVAWSPEVFESDAMRACWERVRIKITDL